MAPGLKFSVAAAAICASALVSQQSVSAAPLSDTAACNCAGAVASNLCYSTLAQAIASSKDGDVVQFGNEETISQTISVGSSVSIQGVACGGRRPSIRVDISDKTSAFQLTGQNQQSVTLDGFDMQPAKKNQLASAVRSTKLERSLSLLDMNFIGFRQEDVNGTVVFMQKAKNLNVDGGSFVNNVLATDPTPKETGGQLHVEEVSGSGNVRIGGTWKDNRAEALHSLGGAVYLGTVAGNVELSGDFTGNFATDGGAVHVRWVRKGGKVNLSGTFEGNTVKDLGYKCRGAVMHTLLVGNGAEVVLSGSFTSNSGGEDCRGAVYAINNVQDSGKVSLTGEFKDNIASEGTVLSITMGTWTGTVELDANAKFSGNQALSEPLTNIMRLKPCGLCSTDAFDVTLSEDGWTGQTKVVRGGIAPEHLDEVEASLNNKDWITYYYGKRAEKYYIRDYASN